MQTRRFNECTPYIYLQGENVIETNRTFICKEKSNRNILNMLKIIIFFYWFSPLQYIYRKKPNCSVTVTFSNTFVQYVINTYMTKFLLKSILTTIVCNYNRNNQNYSHSNSNCNIKSKTYRNL